MSKKIKITEDQLKRLVENNKKQVSENWGMEEMSHEGQMGEVGVLDKLKKEVHDMLNDMEGNDSDYSAGYNQALLNVISAIDFENGGGEEEHNEPEHFEKPDEGFSDEEMDESNTFPDSDPISDPMMNESIEKIKTNFKRFL